MCLLHANVCLKSELNFCLTAFYIEVSDMICRLEELPVCLDVYTLHAGHKTIPCPIQTLTIT